MIDCTDDELITEARARGFLIFPNPPARPEMRVSFSAPLTPETCGALRPLAQSGYTDDEWKRNVEIR